jgi:hypothetical protein
LKIFLVSILILCATLFWTTPVGGEKTERHIDENMISFVEPQEPPVIKKEIVQQYQNMSVPANYNSFSYMPHSAITSVRSAQMRVKNIAYTDIYGLRCVKHYYLVAMGTYYGKVGDTFKIHTASGGWYMVMLGDMKSDRHTDASRRVCQSNGSIIEFIVDESKINSHSRFNAATAHLRDKIVKIEKEIK